MRLFNPLSLLYYILVLNLFILVDVLAPHHVRVVMELVMLAALGHKGFVIEFEDVEGLERKFVGGH